MPMPIRNPQTHQVIKSNHPAEIKTQNLDPWNQTTKPRPTKSNHLAIKLYLYISSNTPKAKWISCLVAFGLWSFRSTRGGWTQEEKKLQERGKTKEESERGERRKNRKIKKERHEVTVGNKIIIFGLRFILQWVVIDTSHCSCVSKILTFEIFDGVGFFVYWC